MKMAPKVGLGQITTDFAEETVWELPVKSTGFLKPILTRDVLNLTLSLSLYHSSKSSEARIEMLGRGPYLNHSKGL